MKKFLILFMLVLPYISTFTKDDTTQSEVILVDTTRLIQKISTTSTKYGDSRTFITYNEDGKEISNVVEFLEDDVWVKSDSVCYTYDDNGNLISETFNYLNNGVWEEMGKYKYEYDEGGNKIEESSQMLENGEWIDLERTRWTYDSKDSMLVESKEGWDGIDWVVYERTTMEFDENGNNITRIEEETVNNIFGFYYKYEYTYNEKNWRMSYMSYRWDNEWMQDYRGTYSRNEKGDWTSTFGEKFSDGEWKPYLMYYFDVDERGNRTRWQLDYWRNEQWETSSMCSFVFNENNQLTSQLYEKVANGEKTNYYQILYTYDSEFNLLHGEYNRWVAGTWQLYDYSFSFTDYFGNNFSFSVAKFDLTYWNTTHIFETINPFEMLFCYPNPTDGEVTVELNNLNETIISYSLLNNIGEEVDGKQNIQTNQQSDKLLLKENFSHLPSGVYYFLLKDRNKSYMNKIIIEK